MRGNAQLAYHRECIAMNSAYQLKRIARGCLMLWLLAGLAAAQQTDKTHPNQDSPELYLSFFFFHEDFAKWTDERVAAVALVMAVTSWGQSSSGGAEYAAVAARAFCSAARDPKTCTPISAEDVHQARLALHAIVSKTILAAANAPAPSEKSIQTAIATVQGDDASWPGPEEGVPYASLSNARGTPILVTAFGVLTGGGGIPSRDAYIQFYSRVAGTWKLAAEAGREFDGCMFSVARVPAPSRNEAWHLAWGRAIGDTGARLRVRLYGFDGWRIRTISERDNLRRGILKISGSTVTLTYEEAVRPEQRNHHRRVMETLHVGKNGLERASISYSPAQQ